MTIQRTCRPRAHTFLRCLTLTLAGLVSCRAPDPGDLRGGWTLACGEGGGVMDVVFRTDGTASIGDSPYVYTADESGPPPHELDLVAPNGLRLVGLYGPGAEGGSVALILRLAEEGRPQDLGAESLRLFRRRPDAEAFARSAYEARVLVFRLTAW